MNCHDATARFSDLRDGLLSGDELAEVERHVTNCPVCRMEWADFREAVEALHGLGSVEPSPGFAARVRAQIEAPPWHHRLARRLFMPWQIKLPLEAAALVLLVIGITVIYQRLPEMRQVVERPTERQAPAPIAPKPRDTIWKEEQAPRTAARATPQSQVAPLTKEAQGNGADEAAPQAKSRMDEAADALIGKQPPSRDLDVAASPAPVGQMQAPRREAAQAPPAPSEQETRPMAPRDSQESARLQATRGPAQAALQPFRIITLRTRDVAAAEERVREWIGLVGGRLLDPPVPGEPTPPGSRALSLIVPRQAVPRLDALLAELGQLFGRELEAPRSAEVLISLTISPKMPPPSGSE